VLKTRQKQFEHTAYRSLREFQFPSPDWISIKLPQVFPWLVKNRTWQELIAECPHEHAREWLAKNSQPLQNMAPLCTFVDSEASPPEPMDEDNEWNNCLPASPSTSLRVPSGIDTTGALGPNLDQSHTLSNQISVQSVQAVEVSKQFHSQSRRLSPMSQQVLIYWT
jgi:hypothetical protein